MTEATVDSDWQRRQARIRATWRDTFLLATLAGGLVAIAVALHGGARAALAVGAALTGAGALIRGTLDYMRSVDEQERDANLWGCYAGMCVYFTLFVATWAARIFGLALPGADLAVFVAVMATTLGVFAWKRFR